MWTMATRLHTQAAIIRSSSWSTRDPRLSAARLGDRARTLRTLSSASSFMGSPRHQPPSRPSRYGSAPTCRCTASVAEHPRADVLRRFAEHPRADVLRRFAEHPRADVLCRFAEHPRADVLCRFANADDSLSISFFSTQEGKSTDLEFTYDKGAQVKAQSSIYRV